jgi:hypothetical protein
MQGRFDRSRLPRHTVLGFGESCTHTGGSSAKLREGQISTAVRIDIKISTDIIMIHKFQHTDTHSSKHICQYYNVSAAVFLPLRILLQAMLSREDNGSGTVLSSGSLHITSAYSHEACLNV